MLTSNKISDYLKCDYPLTFFFHNIVMYLLFFSKWRMIYLTRVTLTSYIIIVPWIGKKCEKTYKAGKRSSFERYCHNYFASLSRSILLSIYRYARKFSTPVSIALYGQRWSPMFVLGSIPAEVCNTDTFRSNSRLVY